MEEEHPPEELIRDIIAATRLAGVVFDRTELAGHTIEFFKDGVRVKARHIFDYAEHYRGLKP